MPQPRALFLSLLATIGLPLPASLVPATPVINLGFCGADDHLLVGIGGDRFGVYSSLYHVPGIFAKLELWASEDDVTSMIDAAIAGESVGKGMCLDVVTYGGLGQQLVATLRASPEFAQIVKDAILEQLRAFRADAYVQTMADYWRMRRAPESSANDNGLEDDLEDDREEALFYVHFG